MKNPFKDLSNHNKCGFAIILSLCFLIACDSDDAPSQESLLPPITMTGENTFGCLIDGKFFRPRDGNGNFTSTNRGMRVRQTENVNIELDARDFKSDRTSNILIHLENLNLNGVGVYTLGESNGLTGIDGNDNNYIHCRIWNDETNSYEGYVSYTNSGSVEISYINFIQDEENIRSGTFETRLVNIINPLDTIKVELGRFDLESYSLRNTTFN